MYATRPGHDDRRYPITVAKYDEVRDVAQLTVGVPSRVELRIAAAASGGFLSGAGHRLGIEVTEGRRAVTQAMFRALRDVSSAPVIDLAPLLDAVIYNYLVGNNDAHGKNFSLLYKKREKGNLEIRLSPLYDIVSTVYYPELSRDMAMKLAREYSWEKIMPRDFEQLAEEAGLGKAPGQTPRARACRDCHGRSRENRDAYKNARKKSSSDAKYLIR
jgi:HipA-like C-terminal domain